MAAKTNRKRNCPTRSNKKRKSKKLMKRGDKSLAAWVKSQTNRFKRNRRHRKNESVEMGFYDSTGFHPIRASDDYDPSAVGEGSTYAKAKAKKKKKKSKKNPSRRANPRQTRAVVPRNGSTGRLKAKEVEIITHNGQIREVKVVR